MAKSNKAAAVQFMELIALGKVREAYELHVRAGFRHHNPNLRGDATSLLRRFIPAASEPRMAPGYPNAFWARRPCEPRRSLSSFPESRNCTRRV